MNQNALKNFNRFLVSAIEPIGTLSVVYVKGVLEMKLRHGISL